MPILRVACALASLAALAAVEPAREYTTQPVRTITVASTDARQIAKAALFVTDDGGATWRKDQEVTVAADAGAPPAFTFTAPRDGVFGLWTVATSRDGRSEPEPVAGAAPKLELVVDRAAPSLVVLDATLGGVGDNEASLAVSWEIADPHLGREPVTIEVSTDQGSTFAARHNGGPTGTTALLVPVPPGTAEAQVRLVARDRAGNVLTTPAKAVVLPQPANPEAELAAAVAALPSPGELGIAGRGGSPMVTAGSDPVASPTPEPVAATPQQPAASAPRPATPATPAWMQPGSEPDQPAHEPELVTGRDVEARYAREAGSPVAAPRGRQVGDGSPAPAAWPAQPSGPRGTVADPGQPFLSGESASAELSRARSAEVAGDVEDALSRYLRLHRSSLAKTALDDHLTLLRRVGDQDTIVAVVEQLPPELRTDAARLHAARAYLLRGQAEPAAAWASRVRASASEAREATFVLAQALRSLGKTAESRALFDRLADGNDAIGAQARALRD